MINGWILTGFPKNSSQMNYFEQVNPSFKPSLIVVIELDDTTVESRVKVKRIDPNTGKVYYVDSDEFAGVNATVANRLITRHEDKLEIFRKRLDTWKKFTESVLGQNIGNILRLNGEMNFDNQIETISDAMENASEK